MSLDDFLLEAGGYPWKWGSADCTMFGADWVKLATGKDPGARFRDKYSTELGARKMIRRHGGFVGMISAEMERLGFVRTSQPRRGDLGLIEVPVRMADTMPVVGAVVGIHTGVWWVAKGLNAIRGGHFPCIAAWDIGA